VGNRLDINSYVYYWNDVKVDVPREEFKIASGNNSQIIETCDYSPVTTGDKSPIATGDDSPISQKDWNIGFAQGTKSTVPIYLITTLWGHPTREASHQMPTRVRHNLPVPAAEGPLHQFHHFPPALASSIYPCPGQSYARSGYKPG